ncbi:SCF ubiquitin ligase complex subunit cdc4 [Balamuthia mandrillaris]
MSQEEADQKERVREPEHEEETIAGVAAHVQACGIISSLLPTELWLSIFCFLSWEDLSNLALVCRHFHLLTQTDNPLWKHLYLTHFSTPPSLLLLYSSSSSSAQQTKHKWRGLVRLHRDIEKNWQSGRYRLHTLQDRHTDRVWSARLDLEASKLYTASTSDLIQIWDLHPALSQDTSKQTASDASSGHHSSPSSSLLRGHTAEVRCLEVRGNTLVSGAYDSTVRVWDVAGRKLLRTLAQEHDVYALQFDEEKIVCACGDGALRVFAMESGDGGGEASSSSLSSGAVAPLQTLLGHSACLRAVKYDKNMIISGGEDALTNVWDMRTGKCERTVKMHDRGVSSLQFKDNLLMTGSFDTTVKMVDLRTFECIRTLTPNTKSSAGYFYYYLPLSVWSLQFDDKKLVTSHGTGNVKIWNYHTGEELATTTEHRGEVITLNFSLHLMATGGEDRSIKLYDFSPSSIEAH